MAIATYSLDEVVTFIKNGRPGGLAGIPEWAQRGFLQVIGDAEQAVGKPLFDAVVAASAGVSLSDAPGAQEAEAVKMVQRMLGFGAALPFVTTSIRDGLKSILGDHAPEATLKAIEELPLDLGINFFIGTVLERIFETAVSRPLEEAIAEQKRPARMEWPQIRSLARQKLISPEELRVRLERNGWRDIDIPLLLNLDRQLLSVADLQQAFIFGLRDEAFIRNYLNVLGFSDEDLALVVDIYLKRAETAGGDQLRAVAQKGYLDGRLSEQEYRGLLTEAHVPPPSIDLEVQAANLLTSWGRKTLSTAEVKKLLDDGVIDDNQAHQRLLLQGYTDVDASALIKDWHTQKELGHPGLTENRILAYLKGGVLTRTQAYDRLVGEGVRAQDASFLVDHPDASPQTATHRVSRSTILAAYKDELLDQPTTIQLLIANGESPDEAMLSVQVVNVGLRRGKKPRQDSKVLSEGTILEAYKLGMVEQSWVIRELVTVGYTEADAMLISEVEHIKLDPNALTEWTMLT